MANISFSQDPQEAVKYLKQKKPELHFDYDEILHEAHHKAFTVAKVTRLDLLNDIQNSLIKARKEGMPFEAWKKEIKPMLKAKGWYGYTTVTNPKTKEVKEIFVGSRRLRNIFYTNTRVAYNVGRWQHQDQLTDAPYLRYVSILDHRNRPTHAKNHGIIRHKDDAFWNTHYPPNGWNCRCRVQAYSISSIKRRGWEAKLKEPTHTIASKDWAYDVRTGSLANLEEYREQRVASAPMVLREKAREELAIDKLFKKSYTHTSSALSTYIITHRPKHSIDKNIPIEARYISSKNTIEMKSTDVSEFTYRHELGHHIDNINGFFSVLLINETLKKDHLIWKQNKHLDEISTLPTNPEDIALHDIIYLVSKRKHGEATRRDDYKISSSKTAKEVFANIFEMILSNDYRLGIIKKYFPSTVAKVQEILKELK